jgi:hypothetical protein
VASAVMRDGTSEGGITMTRRTRWILASAAAAIVAVGIGGTAVARASSDSDQPITGPDLERASAAALAYTGGGRVTETEVGDEESYYEVEVTLSDGRQIDVQLDQNFVVVSSSVDEQPDDSGPGDGGND